MSKFIVVVEFLVESEDEEAAASMMDTATQNLVNGDIVEAEVMTVMEYK